MDHVPGTGFPRPKIRASAAARDADRATADTVLQSVHDAVRSVDTGRSAPSFREGQPETGEAYRPEDLRRLTAISKKLDPYDVLTFVRAVRPAPGQT